MYADGSVTRLEKYDQCNSCSFAEGEKVCPLIEALYYQYVFLTDEYPVYVENCSFYENKRHLKVVS